MPVFLTMTHGMTDRERQSVVSRATLVAFITIMVFTFAGQFLFKFFGISTNGFRIAGGVIIFKIGFDMLQARYTPMKLKDEEIKTYADDISITPLGIPMLCGPGAIANAIVLMQDAHTIQMKGVLIGMIAFIYLITFFILRASTYHHWHTSSKHFIYKNTLGEFPSFFRLLLINSLDFVLCSDWH